MTDTPFRVSADCLNDATALRARLEADGYLFVPGLLPADSVCAVRDDILRLCRRAGWADERGMAACEPVLEGHDGWWDVYDPLQRLESFHALAHHPALLGLAQAVIGEPVLVHPRNIGRITFPGAAHFTTPPHQDRPLIQGAPATYTAWTPLCDCPRELGGLSVLEGSHRAGLLPVEAAAGPGGLAVRTEGIGAGWRAQDLQAGDVLFFHSHTVHRALPNVSAGQLRISADYRYQAASEPVVEDSLQPHYLRMQWDDVYRGWKRADLQYYWRRQPLRVVARDAAIMTPSAAGAASEANG